MCQSVWDMLSRHLAKHSGAFCAGCSLIPLFCGWGERFSFKLVALEGSRVPSAIRADFMQLLERLGEERLTLLLQSKGSEKSSCKWLLLNLTAIWAGWSVLRALYLAVSKSWVNSCTQISPGLPGLSYRLPHDPSKHTVFGKFFILLYIFTPKIPVWFFYSYL